jgi:hypothetical protein
MLKMPVKEAGYGVNFTLKPHSGLAALRIASRSPAFLEKACKVVF